MAMKHAEDEAGWNLGRLELELDGDGAEWRLSRIELEYQ